MLDFGALAPEVNSGRMYTGAGSGPLLAAASAWEDLAAELQSVGASYNSTIESLTAGPWKGPSSIAMAAAATPYVAWINATGAQAEEAASQARLAAGAYESAFAATVPPPVIAANRALLATLIATNFLGLNTPAIASTEAAYSEMWAQDAAAMYAYAGSSSAASQLEAFGEPPQTTSGSSTGAPAASLGTQLSQFFGSIPTALQSLASGLLNSPSGASTNLLAGLDLPNLITLPALPSGISADLTSWNTVFSTIASGPYSLQGLTSILGGPFLSFGQAYAWGQNGQGLAAFAAGPKAISGVLAPLTQGAGLAKLSSAVAGGPVSGSMGKAALVSGLSVPQGWTQAAPPITTLAEMLPVNLSVAQAGSLAGEGGVFGQMALSSLAGRAAGAVAAPSAAGAVVSEVEAEAAAATIIVIPVLEA